MFQDCSRPIPLQHSAPILQKAPSQGAPVAHGWHYTAPRQASPKSLPCGRNPATSTKTPCPEQKHCRTDAIKVSTLAGHHTATESAHRREL